MHKVRQVVTTKNQPFTSRMHFLLVNQQCQSMNTKTNIFHGPAQPKLTRGLSTWSFTTISSWLPRGKFTKPLISPLMPVPHWKLETPVMWRKKDTAHRILNMYVQRLQLHNSSHTRVHCVMETTDQLSRRTESYFRLRLNPSASLTRN